MSNKFTLTGVEETHHRINGLDVWARDVSDGYHTMHELYQHRMALNVALFNAWHRSNGDAPYVFKSKLHYDGTMFEGGYFIVMAIFTRSQKQISYHYKLEHWLKFAIPELERCPQPYDGHTPEDTIRYLQEW